MAKCPECGKIWICKNPDESLYEYYRVEDEAYEPCMKCKCPECRSPEDRITIEEEWYGKRKTIV